MQADVTETIQKRKDYRTVARVRHHKQVAVALQPYLAQVLANGNTLGTRLVAAEVVVAAPVRKEDHLGVTVEWEKLTVVAVQEGDETLVQNMRKEGHSTGFDNTCIGLHWGVVHGAGVGGECNENDEMLPLHSVCWDSQGLARTERYLDEVDNKHSAKATDWKNLAALVYSDRPLAARLAP